MSEITPPNPINGRDVDDHAPPSEAVERGRAIARRLLDEAQAEPARPRDARPRDLLLAIGDSWFAYWPKGDILDVLEDKLGQAIERKAHAGRKLAEMLYREPPSLLDPPPSSADAPNGAEIRWLVDRLRRMSAEDKARLLAILVSAGGNDVAGDPGVLAALVCRRQDKGPLLNDATVRKVVDGRMREHYLTLVGCIAGACDAVGLRRVPIVLHGYDHPVPDGRGFLGRVWLKPVLEELGYRDLGERREIMKLLIDRLNDVQQRVVREVAATAYVHHVDLRGALAGDPKAGGDSYKVYWQNELHPTIPFGFGKVGARFIAALRGLRDKAIRRDEPAGERAPGATASPSSRTPPSPAPAANVPPPPAPGPA